MSIIEDFASKNPAIKKISGSLQCIKNSKALFSERLLVKIHPGNKFKTQPVKIYGSKICFYSVSFLKECIFFILN